MSNYDMDLRFARCNSVDFEKKNIETIKNDMSHIQQKTFSKWMNSHLKNTNLLVRNLFTDLRDGRILHALLSSISGEKLPPLSKGSLRLHLLENVRITLEFLKGKGVPLQNIGAADVVDGNPNLTLGLVWIIILTFQTSPEDMLLRWAKSKTQNYPGIEIEDMTKSWSTGLALNAILHSYKPDLFDFEKLSKAGQRDSLIHAFELASKEFNVPPLLDAEDVENNPDRKSIIMYLSEVYRAFETNTATGTIDIGYVDS